MFYILKVFERRKNKFKCISFFVLLLCTASIIVLNYFSRLNKVSLENVKSDTPAFVSLLAKKNSSLISFNKNDLDKRIKFDTSHDVFIFVHIQKTGGSTFGRHLVGDSNFQDATCHCAKTEKRCHCKNAKSFQWVMSRYSTGWVCGLHADWTELQVCAPKYLNHEDGLIRDRRLLYMTILREPVNRYLSEWRHVSRGSTWATAPLRCNGRKATRQEVPFCYEGKNWKNVTLEEFISCPHNLAHNRQTRMLADLTLVDCYKRPDPSEEVHWKNVLLQSAMRNLKSMPFFGLTEYQAETQLLFEFTFGLKFNTNFTQSTDTHASKINLTSSSSTLLRQRIDLDLQLYDSAKRLFLERVNYVKIHSKESENENVLNYNTNNNPASSFMEGGSVSAFQFSHAYHQDSSERKQNSGTKGLLPDGHMVSDAASNRQITEKNLSLTYNDDNYNDNNSEDEHYDDDDNDVAKKASFSTTKSSVFEQYNLQELDPSQKDKYEDT